MTSAEATAINSCVGKTFYICRTLYHLAGASCGRGLQGMDMMPSLEKLTPGQIDGHALRTFRYGACGVLAIALHDETGWPIIAITDHRNVHDQQKGGASALHWAVEHPDGVLVDIDGIHDADALIEGCHGRADGGRVVGAPSTRADVVEWYAEAQGEPVPLAL